MMPNQPQSTISSSFGFTLRRALISFGPDVKAELIARLAAHRYAGIGLIGAVYRRRHDVVEGSRLRAECSAAEETKR